MNKFFIISGSYEEARNWARVNRERITLENLQPQFVAGPGTLKGVSNPNGVFVGTWSLRSDALDILHALVYATDDMNKKQLFIDQVKKVLPSESDRSGI